MEHKLKYFVIDLLLIRLVQQLFQQVFPVYHHKKDLLHDFVQVKRQGSFFELLLCRGQSLFSQRIMGFKNFKQKK